jgi:hypothetical protein
MIFSENRCTLFRIMPSGGISFDFAMNSPLDARRRVHQGRRRALLASV